MSSVTPSQRFSKRTMDCPACGSNRDIEPGHCWGAMISDTAFYCTREEFAGALRQRNDSGWQHRLGGPCPCGVEHDANGVVSGEAGGTATGSAGPAPRKRRLQALIPPSLIDGWRQTAQYTYERADGSLHHKVVRFDPPLGTQGKKRCMPFQPIGDDWANDHEGLDYILYNLPALVAADASVPVFIVEGEKVAKRLIALGLLATTSEGGAGKWHLMGEHARQVLAGRVLVALPDYDQAGRDHTNDIVRDQADTAARLHVLTLPGIEALGEGADADDWLDAGHTLTELLLSALTAPIASAQPSAQPLTDTWDTLEPPNADAPAEPTDPNIIPWERTARHARQRDAWRARLNSNPRLRQPVKAVAATVYEMYSDPANRKDPDGFMPLYLPKLAERHGAKPQWIGEQLSRLDAGGAIERRYTSTVGQDGMPVKRLSIKPTAKLLEQPEQIEVLSQWGGKRPGAGRPTCPDPDCRSEDVMIVEGRFREIRCRSCGNVHTETIGKPSVVYNYDAAEQSTEQPQEATEQEASAQDSCPWSHLDYRPESRPESGDSVDEMEPLDHTQNPHQSAPYGDSVDFRAWEEVSGDPLQPLSHQLADDQAAESEDSCPRTHLDYHPDNCTKTEHRERGWWKTEPDGTMWCSAFHDEQRLA